MAKQYIDSGTIKIILLFGGGAAVFFAFRSLLSKSGLLKSEGEKQSETQVYDILSSDTSTQISNSATISEMQAKSYADKIKNAWGLLNDDEEAVYTVFQNCKNTADVLLIIQKYGIYKKEDLVTAIQSRMSSKEVGKINNILKAKGINYQF